MKPAIVVGVLALPLAGAVAGADEVFLRSGGRLNGVVVERRADGIVVDVGPGRVTLPIRLVERIVEGTPAFETFRQRSVRLSSTDVKGWLELARWARDHDLLTQSRQALEHVLGIEPGNPVAHRDLGHVMIDGRWMTTDESYRARGYVQFEGSWVTPEERLAMLGERAAEAQARQAEMEAIARAREAEARARTAEAEARQAEAAEAAATTTAGGIPVDLAYGSVPYGAYGPVVIGGYGYGFGYGGGFRSGRHGGMHGRGSGRATGPACAPTRPPTAPPAPRSNRGWTARSDASLPSAPPQGAPAARGVVGGLRPTAKPAQPAY
jgi:hypothetical protein